MRNKFAKVRDPNDFISCSGDLFHIEYSPVIQPDGSVELIESGKTDIVQAIDSYREQTDISYIIHRLELGDESMKRPVYYGDFTSMPRTYAEALQLVMDGENKFNQLPLDVRDKFDNDFRKWFASSGSSDWYSKMDSVLVKDESKVDEVISNES